MFFFINMSTYYKVYVIACNTCIMDIGLYIKYEKNKIKKNPVINNKFLKILNTEKHISDLEGQSSLNFKDHIDLRHT